MVMNHDPNADPRRPGSPQHRRSLEDEDERFEADREAREGSARVGWLWALPLAALAGLGWYLLSGMQNHRTDQTASQTVQQTTAQGTVTPAAQLLQHAGPIFQALTAALGGIKDEASANAALPRIQAATKDLDKLAIESVQLPTDARKQLAEGTRDAVSKVNALIDAAASQPGAGPVLQPAIAALRVGMDVIAMVPGKPLFYASAPSKDWVPLSAVLNKEVTDRTGNNLGTAASFFVNPEGRIVASLLIVDRQLGIGEKQVAIPFSADQLQRKGGSWHLVINASKEDLERAKGFEN